MDDNEFRLSDSDEYGLYFNLELETNSSGPYPWIYGFYPPPKERSYDPIYDPVTGPALVAKMHRVISDNLVMLFSIEGVKGVTGDYIDGESCVRIDIDCSGTTEYNGKFPEVLKSVGDGSTGDNLSFKVTVRHYGSALAPYRKICKCFLK